MIAERDRRAVLAKSVGEMESRINYSIGVMEEAINRSEGEKQRSVNEAEGTREEILSLARATAAGLRSVAAAVEASGGEEAVVLRITEQYIAQLRRLARKGTSVVLPDGPRRFHRRSEPGARPRRGADEDLRRALRRSAPPAIMPAATTRLLVHRHQEEACFTGSSGAAPSTSPRSPSVAGVCAATPCGARPTSATRSPRCGRRSSAAITLFDTAEAYGAGQSEERLGKATQGPAGPRRHRDQGVDKELRARGPRALLRGKPATAADRLDRPLPDPLADDRRGFSLEAALSAMERLRESGKIRLIGVCNFGVVNLSEIPDPSVIVSDQLPYSLLWRALEFEILPRCAALGIGTLTYSTLLHGLLSGKYRSARRVPAGPGAHAALFAEAAADAPRPGGRSRSSRSARSGASRTLCDEAGMPMAQAALAWAVGRPGITSVLAGARTPAQVAENAARRGGALRRSGCWRR